SIGKLFDKELPDLAGQIAIAFSGEYKKNKTQTFFTTAGKVRDFLSENNILSISRNPFILKRIMNMDYGDFRRIALLLEELMNTFIQNNEVINEERRFDVEVFKDEYIPLAFIVETILPGSINYMLNLLQQSPNPRVVIRFLDSKKNALLNEYITASFADYIDKVKKSSSRRKVKIDLTGMFKLLDIADGFAIIGNTQSYTDILKTLNGREKSPQIYNILVKEFITLISTSLGVEGIKASSKSYKKLYTPFINRLTSALQHIKIKAPAKLPIFKGFIKAMLEDRFWEFIEDDSQPDETGRSLAIHNKNIRAALEEAGINVKRWLGKERAERITAGDFMYYEKSVFEYDPVADINTAISYIMKVIQLTGLSKKNRSLILNTLKSMGIIPEYDKQENITKLKTEKIDKKKDIIAILSDKNNLTNISDLMNKFISSGEVQNSTKALETVTHAKERIYIIIKRQAVEGYKEGLTKLRKYFMVRPILRNPGHDLFMGDFTDCCLAMNSNMYPEAMVDRLIDEGMNVIETIDEATGKTMALLWLYIAEDDSLVIQNIEINAEYERIKPLMDRVGEGMIEYAEKFAKYIGAKRLLMGNAGHGKYIEFVKQRYGERTVPFEKHKIGGCFGEKYYLDS
ncbi:MAG: hypothetical protein KAU58_06890, partial [Candidatus Omnitrophica bacterium]|nr:hypothetical protein [Candidatus Omnitrophota bacterium]